MRHAAASQMPVSNQAWQCAPLMPSPFPWRLLDMLHCYNCHTLGRCALYPTRSHVCGWMKFSRCMLGTPSRPLQSCHAESACCRGLQHTVWHAQCDCAGGQCVQLGGGLLQLVQDHERLLGLELLLLRGRLRREHCQGHLPAQEHDECLLPQVSHLLTRPFMATVNSLYTFEIIDLCQAVCLRSFSTFELNVFRDPFRTLGLHLRASQSSLVFKYDEWGASSGCRQMGLEQGGSEGCPGAPTLWTQRCASLAAVHPAPPTPALPRVQQISSRRPSSAQRPAAMPRGYVTRTLLSPSHSLLLRLPKAPPGSEKIAGK